MFITLADTKKYIEDHKPFEVIYGSALLIGLHWAMVIYFNSSFLSQFVSEKTIALLFTLGSAITCVVLLSISQILKIISNYTFLIIVVLLEIAALVGMAFASGPHTAIPLFILHQALIPLMIFSIDLFMESAITDESTTGGARGGILLMINVAYAVSPFVAGLLLEAHDGSFTYVYLASAALLLPLLFLITRYFDIFPSKTRTSFAILDTVKCIVHNTDLRSVIGAHFLLMLFFVWQVIYVSIYLIQHIGFHPETFGLIMSIALSAYIIFELPIGKLADTRFGEKEMMIFGFVVLGISTALLSAFTAPVFVVWASVMFLTRIGASFVEATTESYFFKHTESSDVNTISIFRALRPFSYVIGAPLASFVLLFMPIQYIFIVLGIIMFSGIYFSYQLKDTR